MRIPETTHRQFLVLNALQDGECPGRHLRHLLRQAGVRQTGPAFYQMMARMEDTGMVRGHYVRKDVAGQMIKERRYLLAESGLQAWRRTRDFYLESLAPVQPGFSES